MGRSRRRSPARFPSVSGQEAGQVGMRAVQPESHTKLRGVELPEVKMGMAPEATFTGLLKASSESVYCQPTPGPSLSEERMARVLSAKVCELVSIGGVFRGGSTQALGGTLFFPPRIGVGQTLGCAPCGVGLRAKGLSMPYTPSKQASKQASTHTDRQTYRHADPQTQRHTHTHNK